MKKTRILVCFTILALCVTSFALPFASAAESTYTLPKDTQIHAKNAIVMSLGSSPENDVVLYQKDADATASPAAMVRIAVGMTAVKIIRDKNLDMDKVTGTYTQQCLAQITGSGLATVGMNIGETWTLRDLLNISMIETAADAVITLANTLCGTQTEFVNQMNALITSKEVGCTNTQFANVHGLDSASQYTTARDMAHILRAAMDYPEMEKMLSQTTYLVKPVKNGSQRTYANVNAMLRSSSSSFYRALAFGRTGYTDNGGRCMASIARDSGYEYLVVVMGCPNDVDGLPTGTCHYHDTSTLYRWAFRNFTFKSLLSKNDPICKLPVKLSWNTDSVMLVPEKDFSTIVYDQITEDTIIKKVVGVPKSVKAPVKKGQVLGKVQIIINLDQVVGEVNLVASNSVEQNKLLAVWDGIQTFLKSPWFYVALAFLAALIIAYVIMSITHNRKRRKKRMKRLRPFR